VVKRDSLIFRVEGPKSERGGGGGAGGCRTTKTYTD